MNIHEYQAKEILRKYGVTTLAGQMAESPDQAVEAAAHIGGKIWVVKAQIHAGGRGKGGGVKIAKSLEEVRDLTKKNDRHDSRHPSNRARRQDRQ